MQVFCIDLLAIQNLTVFYPRDKLIVCAEPTVLGAVHIPDICQSSKTVS